MHESLFNLLESNSQLTIKEIIIHIIMSLLIGVAIYISYKISHSGTIYSKKFNTSLVVLSTLTGMVMTVIGNNLSLSLGMVGALSIVRFRTAVKDSRDTVYIFWAIIVGICCGVGDYVVATIGSTAVFFILLIFGRIKNDNRILLVIRGKKDIEKDVENNINTYFNKKAIMKVKNTTPETVEYIYELPNKTYKKLNENGKSISDTLYELKNIEYINIVTQSDDVSG